MTARNLSPQAHLIYEAADAADKLHLDLFAGPHSWGGNLSESFFTAHLA